MIVPGHVTATAHVTCAVCDTTLHIDTSLYAATWRALEHIDKTARSKGWNQHPVMGWTCPKHTSTDQREATAP